MMKLLTLLLLITLQANSQTVVWANGYLKMSGVTNGTSQRISVTSDSWADYAVTVPEGGMYDFAFTIKSPYDSSAVIAVKTPSGATILGEIKIPKVAYWRYARGQIKLRAGTTKLRLLFGGIFQLESFNYKMSKMDTTSAKPSNPKFVTQEEFKSWIDMLDSRSIKFDKRFFGGDGSDTLPIVPIPTPQISE